MHKKEFFSNIDIGRIFLSVKLFVSKVYVKLTD